MTNTEITPQLLRTVATWLRDNAVGALPGKPLAAEFLDGAADDLEREQAKPDTKALSVKLWRRLGDACDEVPPPNHAEDDYNAGVIEGLSRAQHIIREFLAGDQ